MINHNWVFGLNARLNFGTTVPTAFSNVVINTFEGCAAISDAAGNLLFYTDGGVVRNAANAVVPTTPLQGNSSSTQSAIIVPNPGNPNQYYIFTADGFSGGNNHFNGILLDISTWTDTPISSLMTMPPTTGFSATERVTAIQHANCRDFWVITVIQQAGTTPGSGPGIFRIFLVNPTGVQHVGDTPMNINVLDIGYLKASPNGARLALANWTDNNVLVYPFDNAVGVVDILNGMNIPVPNPVESGNPNHPRLVYGVEFSPSSDLLYYSVIGLSSGTSAAARGYIFQVDLNTSTASTLISQHNNAGGRYALGALQLGPDELIYIAKDGENTLGVIVNPDVPGTGCTINWTYVTLAAGTTCYMGLPNTIANKCDCPCDSEPCHEAVHDANQVLNDRADDKFFTIVANGQTMPALCQPAFEQLRFPPVFTLHWGDGAADQFESHDTEVIYIRINNPYRNLTYKDVTIFNIQVTPNQTLPSGEDALQLIPAEIVCFESIDPCSYVSRDFAFLIQNCVPQGYQISFDYCIGAIEISHKDDDRVSFNINVVAS